MEALISDHTESLGVSKEQFATYEQCRKSGRTNMLDIRMVQKLTKLNGNVIVTIMKNYTILKQKYGVQEERENK